MTYELSHSKAKELMVHAAPPGRLPGASQVREELVSGLAGLCHALLATQPLGVVQVMVAGPCHS